MDFETMDSFLRSFSGVDFDYPFDEKVRVYRVGEKIFALSEDTIKELMR
jgi:predicted DNA-binding protein (MmcQ/YjbR family)